MKLDDISLHELQIYLGELLRRATRSDGRAPKQLVLSFEDEEVIELRRKLWCAEKQLARLEIMTVKDADRRRR